MTFRVDNTVDVRVPKGTSILTAQDGTDSVAVYYWDGDPNGNVAANKGALCLENDSGKPWFKTTDGANTGWVHLTDSNITTGTLGNASGARSVPLNANTLTFNDATAYSFTIDSSTPTGGTTFATDHLTLNRVAAGSGAPRLRLGDGGGSDVITIKSPENITTEYGLTLPAGPPASNGQVLTFQTDGTGSFADASSGVDSSITEGTLTTAAGDRSVPMGGNSLTISNVGTLMEIEAPLLTLETTGVSAPEFRLETNAANYVGITTPDTVTSSYSITLPAAPPSMNDQVLTFQTDGTAAFVDASSGIDSSITEGSLGTASNDRSVNLGTNNLTFTNFGAFNISGGDTSTVSLDASNFQVYNPVVGAAGGVHLADDDGNRTVSINAPLIIPTSYDLTLPTAPPTLNGQVLSFTTGGVASFVTPTGDTNITTGTINAATGDRTVDMDGNSLSFEDVGIFSVESSDTSITGSYLAVRGTGAAVGVMRLYDGDNSHYVGVVPRTATTTSYNITLPAAPPASNDQIMSFQTNGLAAFVDIPEVNITTGTVAAATGSRTIDFDDNNLTFDNLRQVNFNGGVLSTFLFDCQYFSIRGVDGAEGARLSMGDAGNSNFVTLQAPDTIASDFILTLPGALPSSNGQVLSFTTAGVASFVDAPNITTGSLAAATSSRTVDLGTNTLDFTNSSAVGFDVDTFTMTTQVFDVTGPNGTTPGTINLHDADSSHEVILSAGTAVTSTYTITFPSSPPSNGQVMTFDASGEATFTDGPADTSITSGNLASAAGYRTVPMNGNTLEIQNVPALLLNGGTEGVAALRFREDPANGTNTVGLQAPALLGSNITYTLPPTPASNGQVLQSQTDGTMSWKTLNAPVHMQGNLDVGGGATFASPAGHDEGSWFVVTNAAATGTIFGTGGQRVFTGDSVVVRDGVASTTADDGTEWLQFDSGTDVTSVQIGTGSSPQTGAITIHDATTSAVGVIEIANESETVTGSDWTRAVSPAALKAKVHSHTSTYPSSPATANSPITITHSLDDTPVHVTCYDAVTLQEVHPRVEHTDANNIKLTHALPVSANEFVVYVTKVKS